MDGCSWSRCNLRSGVVIVRLVLQHPTRRVCGGMAPCRGVEADRGRYQRDFLNHSIQPCSCPYRQHELENEITSPTYFLAVVTPSFPLAAALAPRAFPWPEINSGLSTNALARSLFHVSRERTPLELEPLPTASYSNIARR